MPRLNLIPSYYIDACTLSNESWLPYSLQCRDIFIGEYETVMLTSSGLSCTEQTFLPTQDSMTCVVCEENADPSSTVALLNIDTSLSHLFMSALIFTERSLK